MNPAAQKLIQYLKEYSNEILSETCGIVGEYFEKNTLDNYNEKDIEAFRKSVIQQIDDNDLGIMFFLALNWIRYFQGRNLKEEDKFFNQFAYLSLMLEKSTLNARESLSIIEYIITRNIKNGIMNISGLRNEIILGCNDAFNKLTAKDLTEERTIEIFYVLNMDEKEFTEDDKEAAITIKQTVKECVENARKLVRAHKILSTHYFEKGENYNEQDIDSMVEAFYLLELSESSIAAFKTILLNRIEKRRKKVPQFTQKAKRAVNEEKLSQKEYNYLFREIETYYDIQNQKVIRPLTLEEIVYLMHLLQKIKLPETEIIKCITNINKAGLNAYNNPLSQFNDYYNKMITLTSNEEVAKALEYIKDCMQALYIPESASDYLFWKKEIANELKKVMKIVNRDYRYEILEGQKLNKR